MPKKIKLNGTVVGDGDAWIYDWFGIPTISPGAVAKALDEAGDDDLEIHINSGGGAVFAGSEIYTMLKEHKSNVIVKITGLAASAASFIAMAGDKVMISPTGQVMIHNGSTSAWGDKGVMELGRNMLSSTDEAIANAYALKTGLPQDELLEMMDKETWLNAQEAQRLGFVDEIMFSEAQPVVTNSFTTGAVLPNEVIEKIRNEILKNQGITGLDFGSLAASGIVNQVPDNTAPSPVNVNENEESEPIMNLKELKEKHPDLVNEIEVQAVTTERSRIAAINAMAGAPGAADFIKNAIENGETAGDVAMKIVQATTERVAKEAENRQKDAENSKAAAVATQQPKDPIADEAEDEDAAVVNMVKFATELMNKRGGRG